MNRVKTFLSTVLHRKKAIICFEKEFFRTGNGDDYWHAHNLDDDQYSKVARELEQKGLVFSAEQKSIHCPDLKNCAECSQMYAYVIGGASGSCLPPPRVSRWKVLVSSGCEGQWPDRKILDGLFDTDLSRGRTLYESPEGKQILELNGIRWVVSSPRQEDLIGTDLTRGRMLYESSDGTKYLGFGPISEVSYLAMYDKARRLGFDARRAHGYASIRGNVHSFFVSLLLRNKILVI